MNIMRHITRIGAVVLSGIFLNCINEEIVTYSLLSFIAIGIIITILKERVK